MNEDERKKRRRVIHRDNWLTIVTGPFKFVIPTFAYVLLYPVMLSKSSMEVVGMWSLLASIVTFVSVADIGFSQLLTREAGTDREKSDLVGVYLDYLTARRTYSVLLVVLVVCFLLVRGYVFPAGGVYSEVALIVSVVLMLIGGILQAMSKLEAAILAAHQDNYIIQIVTALVPVLMYSAAIAGAFLGRPIEGLALGTVLQGSVMLLVYRRRLRGRHPYWAQLHCPFSWKEYSGRLVALTKRGGYLYTISVGMLLRGPVFRLVIASTLGLGAVAVFDIALRLTQTVRELIASGFSVLYPSFSYLYRSGDQASIMELMQISLMILLSLGVAALGTLIGMSEHVLTLWLGSYPPELVPATRILALWQIITLLNVPFWFLLQASHNERVAAISIWAHTGAILLIIPLSYLYKFNLLDLFMYWTFSSVFTQCLIYYHAQKRLSLFWDVILNRRIMMLISMVTGFVLWSFYLPGLGSGIRQASYYAGLGVAVFICFSAIIVFKPVYQFARTGEMTYK